MKTRQEHLDWSKQRALKYIKLNDLDQAFASMCSDLGKHHETEGHAVIELGLMLEIGGHLNTISKMKEWIIGFN